MSKLFFPRTARLGNSLPIECFPLTYNLNDFKGYLRYKTMSSQNVSSEARVKNFFIL